MQKNEYHDVINDLLKDYSNKEITKLNSKVENESEILSGYQVYHLAVAHLKHPLYAEGKYQALGVVQSEIAEFLKAIERGTDEEAVAEAKDAIVTLQRFVLGHHLPEDQRGYGWEKRISE